MPPGNFEILHTLKCVLGSSESSFHACIQYIHTCKLPSSFSSFRKVQFTGVLSSRLCSSDVR